MSEKKVTVAIILLTVVILIAGVFWANKSSQDTPGREKLPKALVEKLAIQESDRIKGTSTPSATLIEYGDFQCPACGAYYQLVEQLIQEFPKDLRFAYRHFPLNQHIHARPAAGAAEAAGNQGKFWEMYDKIFQNQSTWSTLSNAKDTFLSYADDLGLDTERFKTDLESKTIKDKIQNDLNEGAQLGVNSTPAFFLNGEKIQNPSNYEDFKTLIKAAVLKNPISQPKDDKYHTHFNLKVVLANGQAIDFTQDKYQSSEGKELNPGIHFHDGVGDIVHIHKKGMTLGDLFKSLKISFTKECLTLDTGEKFCGDKTSKVRMFVNGRERSEDKNFKPQDLDRILIVYGNSQENVDGLISSVADTACIYSEKCPERGTPPKEKCVGGLGTECE